MKILMIYVNSFTYKTTVKTLEEFPDINEQKTIENSLVGFIQVEEKDSENLSKSVTKLIKNLKWASKKNGITKIVLHSFAHLSRSKAGAEITKEIFDKAQKRLENANFEAVQTPFGYFLDLNVDAPGHSQARIFKEF
ncbi:MAG: threonyl-tRNA synthetase editing domain-containing protein [Candidatus Cloacimonadota bacterium]|nr:threonyl-tRNA synthetase editing domain-containing protein [Candidatus Cloacimonadota bacterium]